jgi:lambda family phage portal protein
MSKFATICDWFVDSVSPQRGNRRKAARMMRARFEKNLEEMRSRPRRHSTEIEQFAGGGFRSAEPTRDAASWLKSNLSPDSALELDRDEQNERVDSGVKNYELAVNHVEGRVVRVAGWGMTVEPEIGYDEAEDGEISEQQEEWNRILRTNWEIVCERIGLDGEELWQIQHQMQRDYEQRGEWFLEIGDEYDPLSPVTMKVQVVDPDLVSTPHDMAGDKFVRMGIRVDSRGRAVGCYIRESHPGDTLDVKFTWRYVEFVQANGMPRMIHHFDRKRSRRGFPRMQVGIDRLKNSEEYDEAELERNFVAACHVGVVHTDLDPDDTAASTGSVTDSDGRRVRDMAPGQMLYAGMADHVEFNSPTGPTGTYAPFMERQGRAFAAGVGTHYELIAGDWKAMSYSTARLLFNVEDATIEVLQLGHECTVKWIYRHFVTRMILAGLVDIDVLEYRSNPWPFWAARVIYPPKAAIDPQREDRNQQVNIEACMMPGSDMVERLNGKPARLIYAAVQRDRKLRKKHGLEEHLPQMGRDQELMPEGEEPGGAPTQAGDSNQESSDANSEKQATGAAA